MKILISPRVREEDHMLSEKFVIRSWLFHPLFVIIFMFFCMVANVDNRHLHLVQMIRQSVGRCSNFSLFENKYTSCNQANKFFRMYMKNFKGQLSTVRKGRRSWKNSLFKIVRH